MSLERLYEKPGHLIRRAQQRAVAIFMDECQDLDLTPVQYAALTAISDSPGLDATRLSALVSFDRSTVGDVLERLEKKGLIVRSLSTEDKRVKVIHIGPEGHKILKLAHAAVERAQVRILSPIPAEHRKDFIESLALIAVDDESISN